MSEQEQRYPSAVQNAVCEKYGMSVLPPEDMVAIAIGSLGNTPIYGTRIRLPDGGNVSWFIHCGTHSTAIDFYQPICIEHLPDMLPLVMKYLCLPTGAKFIIDIQGYEDVWMAE
ncbi:immunity protein Imm33 domain-containing protein [Pseudomonas sp. TWP3-1]|uniref:immunity protein Imm33 domain-containing protein n=1 Tax=Pseudomonas sp. TWP3-1 TaxID=2804631 RepID=UPI003CF9002A